jgi:hypothetical protein
VSYFKDVFIPSRGRVFQHLFTKHSWLLKIRRFLLGETMKFGVKFWADGKSYEYTLEEGPDGALKIFHGLNGIDFKVLKIPLNLVIHAEEDYLKHWVEREEKMMKRPLSYFFYYTLRTLSRARLKR